MKRNAALVIAALVTLAAFASAQKVTISADPDQIHVGRNIYIEKDQTAPGDLVCVGCSIVVHGNTGGDAVAVGGSVDVDSKMKGDIVTVGGTVRLGPGAEVGGDIVTIGGHLERDPAAVVHGSIENPVGGHGAGMFLGAWFLGSLIGLIPLSIILALLCYAIAGDARVQNVASTLAMKTGWSLLAGVGVVVAAIALSVLFSRVSAVLVAVLWFAVFVASILGWTGLSAWIGRRVSATSTPLIMILIGALIVAVLEAIPIFGGFLLIFFLFFSLGSAVISGYGSAPGWMEQRLGPPPASAATRGS